MKYQADFTVGSDLLCETSIKAVNPCIFSGEEWRSIFVSLLKYAVAHGGHTSASVDTALSGTAIPAGLLVTSLL